MLDYFSNKINQLRLSLICGPNHLYWEEDQQRLLLTVFHVKFHVTTPEEVDTVIRDSIPALMDDIRIEKPIDALRILLFALRLEIKAVAQWESPDQEFGWRIEGDKIYFTQLGRVFYTYPDPSDPYPLEGAFRNLNLFFLHWLQRSFDFDHGNKKFLFSFRGGVLYKKEIPLSEHLAI